MIRLWCLLLTSHCRRIARSLSSSGPRRARGRVLPTAAGQLQIPHRWLPAAGKFSARGGYYGCQPDLGCGCGFQLPGGAVGGGPCRVCRWDSRWSRREGKGEWLNTSTYIFYPEPALEGGKTYTVRVNPELRGVDGSPLQAIESWTFSTAAPRLVSLEPYRGNRNLEPTAWTASSS